MIAYGLITLAVEAVALAVAVVWHIELTDRMLLSMAAMVLSAIFTITVGIYEKLEQILEQTRNKK